MVICGQTATLVTATLAIFQFGLTVAASRTAHKDFHMLVLLRDNSQMRPSANHSTHSDCERELAKLQQSICHQGDWSYLAVRCERPASESGCQRRAMSDISRANLAVWYTGSLASSEPPEAAVQSGERCCWLDHWTPATSFQGRNLKKHTCFHMLKKRLGAPWAWCSIS